MAVTSPIEEVPDWLVWRDEDHPKSALRDLYKLQKAGQFCDVSLIVEDHEVSAHRPVLAVCSPYLFDLFTLAEDEDKNQRQFKVKDVDYCSFRHILDYAYTSRLNVPSNEVKGVYKAALKLEVMQVASACSEFLAEHLTRSDCLATRLFAVDDVLKEKINRFIQEHISEVMCEFNIKGLPHLQVEIIGAAGTTLASTDSEGELFRLVMCWMKNEFNNAPNAQLEELTRMVHVLYLNTDNSLTDCNNLDEKCDLNNSDVVKDYKSISKKRLNAGMRNSRESLNLLDQVTVGDGVSNGRCRRASPQASSNLEWSIIATHLINDNSYVGLAILNGTMTAVSLRLSSATVNAGQLDMSPETATEAAPEQTLDRHASLVVLAPMSSARCAAGVASLNGKLIVCGGYDRGECLETVESYDLETNEWSGMAAMNTNRGRIDVAQLGGCLYVCGGSDGTKDLKSVECYDPLINKWSFVADITCDVCHAGVSSLNDRLFLVGGSTGVASSDVCQAYDPESDTWSTIASLNIPRSQAAVSQYAGTLFVIGGSDSWSGITASVEMYDIDRDNWTLAAPLNTARRGAAAVVCQDQLYVIGGTDGIQSLTSTEIYDLERDIWVYGPSMTIPRASVGAVAIDDKIYAIGGFSGKHFLDTFEYFDSKDNEWFAYVPPCYARENNIESAESKLNAIGINGDATAPKINGTCVENGHKNGEMSHPTRKHGREKINGHEAPKCNGNDRMEISEKCDLLSHGVRTACNGSNKYVESSGSNKYAESNGSNKYAESNGSNKYAESNDNYITHADVM